MSNRITVWAWDAEGLSPTQKLVLVKLADNANDDGYCWPSLPYLMKHTCLSNSAVRTAIRQLEEAGLVTRIGQADERGTRPNHYQLHASGVAAHDGGVARENRGGGTRKQGGCFLVPPEPSIEPSIEPSEIPQPSAAPPPKQKPEKPTASRYRWQGDIIRLTERDFDRWRDSFSALDLAAELASLDAWLSSPDATDQHRKGWFHVVAGALKNRNTSERGKASAANGASKPRRPQADDMRSLCYE
jgi:hypothetical protein